MQRALFVIAIVSTIVIGSSASATQASSRQQIGAARKGPVAKLVELERRKNEWLRQRFLGR
jgi:hypothetical protein